MPSGIPWSGMSGRRGANWERSASCSMTANHRPHVLRDLARDLSEEWDDLLKAAFPHAPGFDRETRGQKFVVHPIGRVGSAWPGIVGGGSRQCELPPVRPRPTEPDMVIRKTP